MRPLKPRPSFRPPKIPEKIRQPARLQSRRSLRPPRDLGGSQTKAVRPKRSRSLLPWIFAAIVLMSAVIIQVGKSDRRPASFRSPSHKPDSQAIAAVSDRSGDLAQRVNSGIRNTDLISTSRVSDSSRDDLNTPPSGPPT